MVCLLRSTSARLKSYNCCHCSWQCHIRNFLLNSIVHCCSRKRINLRALALTFSFPNIINIRD